MRSPGNCRSDSETNTLARRFTILRPAGSITSELNCALMQSTSPPLVGNMRAGVGRVAIGSGCLRRRLRARLTSVRGELLATVRNVFVSGIIDPNSSRTNSCLRLALAVELRVWQRQPCDPHSPVSQVGGHSLDVKARGTRFDLETHSASNAPSAPPKNIPSNSSSKLILSPPGGR